MHHTRPMLPSNRASHRAFSFVEVLVVAAILGLFASLVIPRLASAKLPQATPVENTLEADLRLARTEAIARARPVVFVLNENGTAWWIAEATNPTEPIDRTRREFGRGALTELDGVTMEIVSIDFSGQSAATDRPRSVDGVHVIAKFDALGTRDNDVVQLNARDGYGSSIATWTLPAGRTRLQREAHRAR